MKELKQIKKETVKYSNIFKLHGNVKKLVVEFYERVGVKPPVATMCFKNDDDV
jgi:hypothetical protein